VDRLITVGFAAAGVVVPAAGGVVPVWAAVPVVGVVLGMDSVCAPFAPVLVVAMPVQPVASLAHCEIAWACGPPWPAPANAFRRSALLTAAPLPPVVPLPLLVLAPVGSAPEEVWQPPVLVTQCAAPDVPPPVLAGALVVAEPPAGLLDDLWPVESVSHEPRAVWQPA